MLGWTDLKPWMAACSKVSWSVDPLPFSVPESLEPLPDPPLPELGFGDELQAAREKAVTPMASAAVVTRGMRRRCMLSNSHLRRPQAPHGGARQPAGKHVAIAGESRRPFRPVS